MYIHRPSPELSTAENILRLLRPDGQYTELEAKVLDIALIIHAEHGGGNNSTFTTHVVTSTGTDTYSAIAASLGSLKGPKHGGANLKVQQMFKDIESHVANWDDDDEVTEYLTKILNREAFDGKGLIYGIGHAVYTESDPRCVILKKYAQALSEEKGLTREFDLYNRVEGIAIKLMQQHRQLFKPICANVDYGIIYTDLRHLPYLRLVCTPYRRIGQRRQDHPSCLQICRTPQRLRGNRRQMVVSHKLLFFFLR